jgi:hypothetical protein
LQFSIVEEGLPLTGKMSAKIPPKAKKARPKGAAPKPSKAKKRNNRKGKRR